MPRGEGIKPLGSLFEKYKQQLVAPQGSVTSAFVEVIDDLMGVRVDKKDISYTVHTKVLSLRVSGPLKSEIQLRKSEVLDHLKGRLGEKNAPREII